MSEVIYPEYETRGVSYTTYSTYVRKEWNGNYYLIPVVMTGRGETTLKHFHTEVYKVLILYKLNKEAINYKSINGFPIITKDQSNIPETQRVMDKYTPNGD